MVELDARKNHVVRAVVDELGAFIEKGGIILVTFENDMISAAGAPARTEIQWNPANEKPGVQPGTLEHPRGERRRGRFAMGSGHDKGLASTDQKSPERLRKRKIRQFLAKDRFGF